MSVLLLFFSLSPNYISYCCLCTFPLHISISVVSIQTTTIKNVCAVFIVQNKKYIFFILCIQIILLKIIKISCCIAVYYVALIVPSHCASYAWPLSNCPLTKKQRSKALELNTKDNSLKNRSSHIIFSPN